MTSSASTTVQTSFPNPGLVGRLAMGFKSIFGASRDRAKSQVAQPEVPLTACNRFEKVIERIQNDPAYTDERSEMAPYGLYRGRPLIGEKCPINGGIYLGITPHEALVMDECYGRLPELYEEFTFRFVKQHGQHAKERLERG